MPTSAASVVRPGRIASAATPATTATLVTALSASKMEVGPEQVARSRDRVDPLEVERERFGGRAKADLGGPGEEAGAEADRGDRPDGEQERGEPDLHQRVQPVGGHRLGGRGDLREDLAEGGLGGAHHRGAEQRDRKQPAREHERAADVGRARDLPLLARALAVLGGGLLGAVLLRHGLPDVQGAERGADGGGHLVGDPAGDERHRGADEQQRHGDLGGEADGEHVELGHHP